MGKKILLADDSITIQKVIELTFSDEDFDVITVGNGRLALERLPEVRPDIVLCDIIMPERDGYEVCEAIKTNPAYSHLPVLLLTGAFEPFDQERAARAGYDGSLAKPFEPETLIAKVKELLAHAPARAAAPPPSSATRPSVTAPRPGVPAAPASISVPPPLPPPVVPFPRPAAAPPPPVSAVPPRAPAPARPFVPPPATHAATPASFIPDEPFGTFDSSSLDTEVPGRRPPPEPFVPVTPEESASLSAPPLQRPAAEDTATTVMFNAGELPWTTGRAAPPPPVVAPAREEAMETTSAPEPPLVPEPPEGAEVAGETPVFEEVLEEDLEFGPAGYPTGGTGEPGAGGVPEPVAFGPDVATLPPVRPAVDEATTGAFAPVEGRPKPAPRAAAIPDDTFGLGREEFTFEAEPEPAPAVAQPASSPLAGPAVAGAPGARPSVAAQSFADLAAAAIEPETPPAPPSEAAAVAVPVEMVEKIAQRVVAQISEKVVREIAWEVVPDLAEALIKQEIERLKAELQKT